MENPEERINSKRLYSMLRKRLDERVGDEDDY